MTIDLMGFISIILYILLIILVIVLCAVLSKPVEQPKKENKKQESNIKKFNHRRSLINLLAKTLQGLSLFIF